MIAMDKLKSSILVSEVTWRTLLTRLIITLFLLAAVLKIGS
jgi:hypothetical protein